MNLLIELIKDLFAFFELEKRHRQVERLNNLFYYKEQELPTLQEMKAHYKGEDYC